MSVAKPMSVTDRAHAEIREFVGQGYLVRVSVAPEYRWWADSRDADARVTYTIVDDLHDEIEVWATNRQEAY